MHGYTLTGKYLSSSTREFRSSDKSGTYVVHQVLIESPGRRAELVDVADFDGRTFKAGETVTLPIGLRVAVGRNGRAYLNVSLAKVQGPVSVKSSAGGVG